MSRDNITKKLVSKLEKIYSDIAKAKDFKILGYDILATGPAFKTYTLPSFNTAIFFIDEVAKCAEELENFPDLTIKGNKVSVSILTADMGSLTEGDLHLAIAIEDIFKTIEAAHESND